jgi:hypothetical protein
MTNPIRKSNRQPSRSELNDEILTNLALPRLSNKTRKLTAKVPPKMNFMMEFNKGFNEGVKVRSKRTSTKNIEDRRRGIMVRGRGPQ